MVGVAVCFADPEVETANDLKPIFLVEAHSFAVVFSHIKPHAGLAHLFGEINVKRKKLLPHFFSKIFLQQVKPFQFAGRIIG